MGTYEVRTMRLDDLDGLARLHTAAYGDRDNSVDDIHAYHVRMLENSLNDLRRGAPPNHSLVSTCDDQIVGMTYSSHNPMLLHDEQVWSTTATLLATHPDHRNPRNIKPLLEGLMEYSTDVLLADRTNSAGRKAAERATDLELFPQLSLRWMRVLHPARGLTGGLLNRTKRPPTRAVNLLRHASTAIDSMIEKAHPPLIGLEDPRIAARYTTTELTALDLVSHGDALLRRDYDLRPDITSLDRVEDAWARFRAIRPEGSVHRVAVWTREGALAGWFLLHLLPTGTAEVLQLVAPGRAAAPIVALMLHRAKELGAGSVHGTAAPSMLVVLSEAGAYFHGRGSAMLAGTKKGAIRQALVSNRAFVTGLEGEYAMHLPAGGALRMSPLACA